MTKLRRSKRFQLRLNSETVTVRGFLSSVRMMAAGTILILAYSPVGWAKPRPTPTPMPTPSSSQSLSEYAKGRKLRKNPTETKPSVVITNENLENMAAGVELTAVTQQPSPSSESAPATGLSEDPKSYWRTRFQTKVNEIRSFERTADDLSREIVSLWDLFYRCDEADRRDREIKPRLENMIEEEAKVVENLALARTGLDDLVVTARKNGVLPGWYRDLIK